MEWLPIISLVLNLMLAFIIIPAIKFIIKISEELVEIRLIIKEEVSKATKF